MLKLLQGAAKLVGTGCGLCTATDAVELADDVLGLHSAHQLTQSLCVTVASTVEIAVRDTALIIEGHINELTARAVGLVEYLTGTGCFCLHLSHAAKAIYSPSSGFMLVYTVCTSSNSSSLSTILLMVSRCSGVTSFRSLGI